MPQDDPDLLLEAVRDLLDALDPSDRATAMDKLGSRANLEHAMVKCARRVLTLADRTGERPPPGEYRRLAAATLTLSHAGVAQNPGHALEKYRRYLHCRALPPEVLVAAGRFDEELIPLLAATARVRDRVVTARGPGEPIYYVTVVAAACAHGVGLDQDRTTDDEGVDAVIAVLNRGAMLAGHYRRQGRRRAGQGLSATTSRGGADFLEQVAAWHVALTEQVGIAGPGSPPEPMDALDVIENAIPILEKQLDAAATQPVRRSGLGPAEEPDVAWFERACAEFIGAATGDGAVMTRRVVDRLSPGHRKLRTRPDPRTQPHNFSERDPATLPRDHHVSSPEDEVVFGYHLAAWMISTFFDGVEVADRQTLLTWLAGDRPIDSQDDLLFLVCCLRVALHRLRRIPDQPPAEMGLTRSDYRRLAEHLGPALIQAVAELGPADPAQVVAAALPPLWTRRRPAVHLVTAHLYADNPTYQQRAKATLVAAAGVYGPAQWVDRSKGTLPNPCCWRRPDGGHCAHPDIQPPRSSPADPPHPVGTPCRERPWPEVGKVENYTTLAAWAGFPSSEAARKQLERYEGPGRELLTGEWPSSTEPQGHGAAR